MNRLNEVLKDLLKPDSSQVNSLKGEQDPNINTDHSVYNKCYWCQGVHSSAVCQFKDDCSFCKKTGHTHYKDLSG